MHHECEGNKHNIHIEKCTHQYQVPRDPQADNHSCLHI